ncbi:hypothetical protein LOD99_5722 [Oopsacas minuta]|uniref:Uncharacterized protein n=1 Tax=Oopsacas minuta TaxID=111878 RepID=A0AAV7JPF0_9METZ|nr:hypothetical protein LOD99_5722 [Oopsacas minuta]
MTVISHAKVTCASPPQQSSYTPDSKFSPPAKRMKHEISTASTIVFSSDSTSSSERTSSFFPEEVSVDLGKVEKICEKAQDSSSPDCEQDTECSVSEADSTTLNGIRNLQDFIEGKDDNEASEQPSAPIGIQQNESETSQQTPVELAQEKSLIENSIL